MTIPVISNEVRDLSLAFQRSDINSLATKTVIGLYAAFDNVASGDFSCVFITFVLIGKLRSVAKAFDATRRPIEVG